MKWNKVSEKLPLIEKPVFVAMPNYLDQYNENFVYVMKYNGNGYWEYWECCTDCGHHFVENKESDDISKLINSNDEPIVLTDASISELPTEEVKTEESELEQTKTLVDLRNRLNNIRQK